ncbi:MAG: NAD(P)/FAD-dependent oxidoreductase [Clostridia bacterium]|nr:NAD(P)/FAD-dependent oxidoreductase [Clostridia bacterium]
MEKVIIVGAGPAGLTAAYELLKSGGEYCVTVLEESDSIGGISRTVEHNGNRMDIGGHRFFSKDKRVTEWWESIMPLQGVATFDDRLLGRERELSPDGPDPAKVDRVMLKRQRISRIYYKKKFFDYPITMKPQTFINMGLVSTVKAGCSYLKSTAKKLPEDNLENFYINRFGKVLYSMFFEGYTEKLWGRHPSQISADWGAQRVKGLSVKEVLKDMVAKLTGKKGEGKVETSLIEEFSYPKYGPGQLWEVVAEEVEKMGGKIMMNCHVKKIVNDNGRISAVQYMENNKARVMECDTLVSTMPIKDLVAGLNGAGDEMTRIASNLPYRDFVTVGLLLDSLNLKNKTKIKTMGNIVPDCWIYVQDTGVKLGRIQIFNNWSPYMVEDVENKVWIGLEYFCDEGDEFWNMEEKACVDFAVGELIKMGVIRKDAVIRDSHRERVKKAYPAYFDTYYEIDKLIDYLNTIPNLFCIGRNGQHRYNNMDHSMVTAFEAVKNIVSKNDDKSNIWSVNTEKEYHETNAEND